MKHIWFWFSCHRLTSTIDFCHATQTICHHSDVGRSFSPLYLKGIRTKHAFMFKAMSCLCDSRKCLWFELAFNAAISEEPRECLFWASNYCFCLLLRTASNYPPQTRKSPTTEEQTEESKESVINAFKCISC